MLLLWGQEFNKTGKCVNPWPHLLHIRSSVRWVDSLLESGHPSLPTAPFFHLWLAHQRRHFLVAVHLHSDKDKLLQLQLVLDTLFRSVHRHLATPKCRADLCCKSERIAVSLLAEDMTSEGLAIRADA
jgi:hypothetical protein